jgi:hypothetical protein
VTDPSTMRGSGASVPPSPRRDAVCTKSDEPHVVTQAVYRVRHALQICR